MPFTLLNKWELDSSSKYIIYDFKGSLSMNGSEESLQITDGIKMWVVHRYNLSYCPHVKFEFDQFEGVKYAKIKILMHGSEYFQDFKELNRTFQVISLRNTQSFIDTSHGYNRSGSGNNHVCIEVTLMDKHAQNSNMKTGHIKNALQDFGAIINDTELSDFKFNVNGKTFFVHKAILAARSPVFKTMFTGQFSENRTNEGTVEHISHAAFTDFLHFLYTDCVQNLKAHVIELLQVSHQYEVYGLKTMCETELLRGLTEANCSVIFQYAHLFDCGNGLKEAAFKLIKNSFSKNNYKVPDEYVDSPKEVDKLIKIRNEMAKLLKTDETDGTSKVSISRRHRAT